MSELPIFVYGTLRPGGISAHRMDGATWQRAAKTAAVVVSTTKAYPTFEN